MKTKSVADSLVLKLPLSLPLSFILSLTFVLSLFAALPSAMASEAPTFVRNQAVVQVKGVVCSFCAYGTEKALSKLSFLDKSKFGDDGVLMDIHTHRLTLALLPERKLELSQIYHAIKDGGYDPVTFYVNLYGKVRKSGESYLLTTKENGQIFELSGGDIAALVDRGALEIMGLVDIKHIPGIKADQVIPVVLIAAQPK